MKEIKGYSRYSITEYGVVKNIKRDYFLKPRNSGFGAYLTVALINNHGIRKTKLIHRLVAENFIDNPDNLPIVNHKDGNKYNNHVDNLEWVTVSENIQHAYDTGLHVKASGVNSPNTNLSSQKVHNICASLMSGLQINDVAQIHNVSKHVVKNIKNGACFKDITKDYDFTKVKRYERLSITTVIWIAEMILAGYTNNQILNLTDNKNITLQRIGNIRAKRSHTDLLKDFNF